MNKKFKIAAFATVVALGLSALSSCGSGDTKSEKGEEIAFETFSFKTLAVGSDTDSIKAEAPEFSGVWTVESSGVLPTRVGKHDVKALRDTICALAGIRTAEDGKFEAKLPEYLSRSEEKLDSAAAKSALSRIASLKLLSDKLLVMDVYTYQYPEGAAHGGYSNRYINYDLQAGKVLDMGAIFTAGYEPKLLKMTVEKLSERDDLLVSPEEIKLPQNFRLTESGVDLVYGIYEVAPYASGEVTVSFTAPELKELLTPAAYSLFF